LEDFCIKDFEFAGPAAIAFADNTSQLSLLGSYYSENIVPHPSLDFPACQSGLAQVGTDWDSYECIDTWTKATTCMLDSNT